MCIVRVALLGGPVVPAFAGLGNGVERVRRTAWYRRRHLYRDHVENWAREGVLADLTEPIDDYRLAADLADGVERERVAFGDTYVIVVLETPYPSWSYYRLLVYRAGGATAPVVAVDLWRGVGGGIAVPGYRVQVGRRVAIDPPFRFRGPLSYPAFVAEARRRLEAILMDDA